MYTIPTNKAFRIFLATILSVFGVFSSLPAISSVQAVSNPSVLSPEIASKIDGFVVKVKGLRSNYSSDAAYNTFLDTLGSKINALKPQYTEPLVLAVLDRLSSGVSGLKIQKDILAEIFGNLGDAIATSTGVVTPPASSLSGVVYATGTTYPIIIEGARWGMMNLLISGTYPSVNAIVQKIRNHPGVADYATCISINGDVVYGTRDNNDTTQSP